jgi:nucleotide-binding universal stress UspA family protein
VAGRVGAELVVVGATRRSRLQRVFLGSTAQRVLRESLAPVLVTRGRAVRPLCRVLLASDLTGLGAAAQETALDLVEGVAGAPEAVRALYVLPWSFIPPPTSVEPTMDAARGRLDAFLHARRSRAYPLEPLVRAGVPAEEIVAEAREWDADLVVVGTHARGWGARLLLGSVAEATLRDAPCNVLAVPPVRAAAGAKHPGEEPEAPGLAEWAEAVAAP